MKKFMDEFKQFIARGNVMDMAVGGIPPRPLFPPPPPPP